MAQPKRFLFFGAHPDDADSLFGGTAIKLARVGHVVKLVSVCNGDCGHHLMRRAELAARRYLETQAAAAVAGIAEYQVLDNHDCEIECNLENRKEIIRIIRRFQPDVVISHRAVDYHADHRNTGQLVMDAAYLVGVPRFCEDTPIPPRAPVFAYSYDRFTDPRPIRADAAVEIDSVMDVKLAMLNCHVSQYYEWLPFDKGFKDFNHLTMTAEQKRDWLLTHWGVRFQTAADLGRDTLVKTYGDKGKTVKYAEIFEFSPYGRPMPADEFRVLFEP